MRMSPDAFVQMAIQAAYYGLYGKSECSYEPAMTKMFLHGRTEAIRTVTDQSVEFVQKFFDPKVSPHDKLEALRTALKTHTKNTRECSQGLGQDRHLYALECLWARMHRDEQKPRIFTDSGWRTLNHTVISTSNCGNPALRLFGFGPVVANGFGIGYIIKDDRISFVASSKHRQTERLLQTLQKYLVEVKTMLLNEKYPGGVSQRQRILALEEEYDHGDGYTYYDTGDRPSKANGIHRKIGKRLIIQENDE
ncbi:Putative Carnitine O-acetyltransferase [Rhizopus microsporus]|nr:Putative Carnitine O-acetyltransferase [Rhizopus microsporus]